MINRIKDNCTWLLPYLLDMKRNLGLLPRPKHVFFCICDHFEPYMNNVDSATANKRLCQWIRRYPQIVEQVKDADGRFLRYSFFYPEEEYKQNDMALLADLCRSGYGEVEVHLHHHNDTSDSLRRKLVDYKKRLFEVHGLLSTDLIKGEISYGFIHGNWALDNSRRDGHWCGVNDEITILQETGCYADFTMPSAPSDTQTRKINSIYYAVDDPARPKSHDTGVNVSVGKTGDGLLMVQGPLGLNWRNRKFGMLPTIENGGLYAGQRISRDRIHCWMREHVHVDGAPECAFIKIYNHGCMEEMMEYFLEKGGLKELLDLLTSYCCENDILLHFVTAREMANVVRSYEAGKTAFSIDQFDYRYVLNK